MAVLSEATLNFVLKFKVLDRSPSNATHVRKDFNYMIRTIAVMINAIRLATSA